MTYLLLPEIFSCDSVLGDLHLQRSFDDSLVVSLHPVNPEKIADDNFGVRERTLAHNLMHYIVDLNHLSVDLSKLTQHLKLDEVQEPSRIME